MASFKTVYARRICLAFLPLFLHYAFINTAAVLFNNDNDDDGIKV